ncbi:cache domain-containing protein [Shumkonia mesophila]|uniref:cache domain-containing protein n=1 Tax=Shumkonia mesophila TaxID=2838854 RepID=UPI002934BF88|nr:cache domain-containing protein [Shumkonia mesophila]
MTKAVGTFIAAFLLLSPLAGNAAERGSGAEARALVEKAVAKIKTDGPKAAFAAFESKDGGFVDRDLYIFVFDFEGKVLSHGASKNLIGQNLVTQQMKDADGKVFADEFVEVAKTRGEGWVDYKWANPVTQAVEPKSSFVKKVDDTMLLGCGFYK